MHACSLLGSSDHGTIQARILEWVAIPFYRGDLPNPGIKFLSLVSPTLHADFLTLHCQGSPSFQTHKAKRSQWIAWGPLQPPGWVGLWGRMDECVHEADPLGCPLEMITALQISCTAVQKN